MLQTAGAPDGRQMTAALVDWAHARLTVACTGPRPGTAAHALPGLHLELTVATLLLECASRVLPDVASRALALEAVGRALRTGSPTGRAARTPYGHRQPVVRQTHHRLRAGPCFTQIPAPGRRPSRCAARAGVHQAR
ncbi:hypothetical protein [Streptomyces sp. NPDC059468]|uniref:hypothetical protein n=1 Tax=unclassified Streptomyces TaxID=2593676 RepID=UPI0036B30B5D